MKQALNRLALYCATRNVAIKANAHGCFSIAPHGAADMAQAISVDELAGRIESMNSAPMSGPFDVPGYEQLAEVLAEAFNQAARGKGKERHAKDAPFHEQPMQQLCDLYGVGFATGQAAKKMQEAARLPHDAGIRELLGAIVYCAGAVIAQRRHHADRSVAANDASVQGVANA